jgi:hypothetical protein
MFGMQAINFCAQRGILYFIHQAPPNINEHLHISPQERNPQVKKGPEVIWTVEFAPESPLA